MCTSASYCVYFGLVFAAIHMICSRPICAQLNFSLDTNSFDCSSTLICLGDAHQYAGDFNGLNAGTLSLVSEGPDEINSVGIAYYHESVRMRDRATGQSYSFNATFAFTENMTTSPSGDVYYPADGITFVLSANKSHKGDPGKMLGFFGANGTNSFQSIVVEFDNYFNQPPPINDIGWNHVSLDFTNITYVVAENASDVNVSLWQASTTYAWVEYSATTQQFEVRVSNNQVRPMNPLLNYSVDLFDKVEDYMWVGFSGATTSFLGQYYIHQWTFESYTSPPNSTPPVSSPPTSTPPISSPPKSKMGIIVGVSVGFSALLAVLGIFLLLFARRRDPDTGKRAWRWHDRESPSHGEEEPSLSLAGMPQECRIRYKDLSVATDGFSEGSKLGQGGFGSVYRGILPKSGTLIAVKKISRESHQGEREFMAEVSIISQLRHRNLIQLLGWCNERGEYLIVYELMPNGSLDKVLFGRQKGQHTALSWARRFNIITGTAAALDYLHQGWKQRVIHRDVKASNIMLDDEWSAKLGDFGLARLVDHQRTPITTLVAGTRGYVAPEAASSGKFTDKTDVFAFGAVALEIACGRKSFAPYLPPEEMVLVDWVWHRLHEGTLLSVVDRRLGDYDVYWMEAVLRMGLLCSHPDPEARPAMRHVVQVLAGDAPVPPIPACKPVPVFISGSDSMVNLHLPNLTTSSSKSKSTSSVGSDSARAEESGLLSREEKLLKVDVCRLLS